MTATTKPEAAYDAERAAETLPIAATKAPADEKSPAERASLLARVSFHFTWPLLKKGADKPLEFSDLPPLPAHDHAVRVSGAAQRTPASTMISPSASRASRLKRNASVRILVRPRWLGVGEKSGKTVFLNCSSELDSSLDSQDRMGRWRHCTQRRCRRGVEEGGPRDSGRLRQWPSLPLCRPPQELGI
jgi:hypothetical protein